MTIVVTGQQWQSICNSPNTTFVPQEVCKVVPVSGQPEDLETWDSCPDDCLPTAASGCGVCGNNGNG